MAGAGAAKPAADPQQSAVGHRAKELKAKVNSSAGWAQVHSDKADIRKLRAHFGRNLCWCCVITRQTDFQAVCPFPNQTGHERDGVMHQIDEAKRNYVLANFSKFAFTDKTMHYTAQCTCSKDEAGAIACIPKWASSDTSHGAAGYQCERWHYWDTKGKWLSPSQRSQAPTAEALAAAKEAANGKASKGKGRGKGKGKGKGKGRGSLN